MGCNEMSQTNCSSDEKPYHKIFLSSYAIDKFEVTAEDFKKCIDSGFCNNENMAQFSSFEDSSNCNAGAPGKEKHPVKCVNWYGARRYCEWVGKRLPTEAEWEKAARGTDERIYPWGDEVPSCDYAIMLGESGSGCDTEDSFEVGSKEIGKSYYGLYDMAGNVWEWVSDYYKSDYYAFHPFLNPIGPYFGNNKIMRGGGASSNNDLLSYKRQSVGPTSIAKYYGFRCAKSIDNIKKGAICTGQTNCYNDTAQSVCPTNEQDFYGQDVQYYLLGKCNQRSYTLFETATDEIIIDDATGLQWQRKLPETYSGCTKGSPAGSSCTWQQAINYCDGLTYGGYADWRLPTVAELRILSDYSKHDFAIDTAVFNGINLNYFWSSSSSLINVAAAWLVNFSDGGAFDFGKENNGVHAICVRGNAAPVANFKESSLEGKTIITDSSTGLLWTKENTAHKMWKDALNYCESLIYAGFNDWRLPNINELSTLVDYSLVNPSSDFPEIPSSMFWSSSSYASDVKNVWGISFYSGGVSSIEKSNTINFYAICVR
jgi:hypothetical protein